MSSKKKITQNDLRKTMYKMKIVNTKKIQSPLAKYTETGQLMCILCKCIVRSESAWPIHINSSNHKTNIEFAKSTKLESVKVLKRPSSPLKELSPKKTKIENQTVQGQEIKGIPADFFDKCPGKKAMNKNEDNVEKESAIKIVEDSKKDKDNCVPEGFFDDPILDAKARNIEYRNPIDDEWERFQREIREEATQSAQIIEDDQEEAAASRQLEEIDEQIHDWSRVLNLIKLRESMLKNQENKHDSMDADLMEDDIEIDCDEEMDWRAKKSFK